VVYVDFSFQHHNHSFKGEKIWVQYYQSTERHHRITIFTFIVYGVVSANGREYSELHFLCACFLGCGSPERDGDVHHAGSCYADHVGEGGSRHGQLDVCSEEAGLWGGFQRRRAGTEWTPAEKARHGCKFSTIQFSAVIFFH
jgi:hypothetical protein